MPSYDDLIRSLRVCASAYDCDGCIMQGEDPEEFCSCDDLLKLRAVDAIPEEFCSCDDLLKLRAVDAILDLVGLVEKDGGTEKQSFPEIDELYDDLIS